MALRTAVLALLVAGASAYVSPGALPPSARRSRLAAATTPLRMQRGDGSGPFNAKPSELPNIARSGLASLARLGAGAFVSGYRAELKQNYKNPTGDLPLREFSDSLPSIRPKEPLILYEFEACPFCRKVREALSMLDIDAIIYPCPSQGTRFRPKVVEMGGKAQFPYMIDPNTSYQGYESDAIVRYLFQTYGDGVVPLELALGPLTTLSCGAASAFRMGKGRKTRAPAGTEAPEKPLELWGYEGAPFVRVVREALCELEVPYKSITVARGSIKRQVLKEQEGKFQAPFLMDPNTNTSMFESADIVAYIERTYGKGATKSSTNTTNPPPPANAREAAELAADMAVAEAYTAAADTAEVVQETLQFAREETEGIVNDARNAVTDRMEVAADTVEAAIPARPVDEVADTVEAAIPARPADAAADSVEAAIPARPADAAADSVEAAIPARPVEETVDTVEETVDTVKGAADSVEAAIPASPADTAADTVEAAIPAPAAEEEEEGDEDEEDEGEDEGASASAGGKGGKKSKKGKKKGGKKGGGPVDTDEDNFS